MAVTGSEVDAVVGLPQDGAGKQVAVKEIKRADDSTVERQEVVLTDGSDPIGSQTVRGDRGRGRALTQDTELAEEIYKLRLVLEDIRGLLMKL